MKKNIICLCILSLVLTIISYIFILLVGNTYTVSFHKVYDDYEVAIDNKSGEIEIINQKEENNQIILDVKSKKPGHVYIYIVYDDISEMSYLVVHKNMVITDNSFFGKCTGSEIIPISFSIILFYILYLLIRTYNASKKKNLFQYRNIALLGIIIFLIMFIINNIFSIFNYQGLINTVNEVLSSMPGISIILFPVAVITSILVTISNIKLILKEGKSWRNLLGLILGIFLCVATLLPNFIYSILLKVQIVNVYNLNGPGPYIYDFFETLVYLTIAYIECILIGTIIIAIKAVKKKPEYNKDYIIILGCQIRKDGTLPPLLRGRVDKAIEFRNKQLKKANKDLVFIPSGGKGKDEITSEAEAMKKYLLEKGIPKKNIIIEDKSTNTYENINYSNKLIKKKDAKVAFSTTNYHVLRAGLIATSQGLVIDGIGSKTKAYFWINAFIREFVGTLYSERKKHFIVISIIIVVIILLLIVKYLNNNI